MNYLYHWLEDFVLLLRWQLLRLKPLLPLLVVVQAFIGVGTVIGFGFLFPSIDAATAQYLVTGAPALSLIVVGLVLIPQNVAMAKSEGSYDYIYTLPVSRLAILLADMVIWLLAVIPSLVLAIFVGAKYYNFHLVISPIIVPGVLLVALTATSIGCAVAQLSPSAQMVTVITNFLAFFLFLFSPISFPAERLPDWLAALHSYLPVKYAADLVRGTLIDRFSDKIGISFLVLSLWMIAGFALTYRMMTRRR